MERRGLGRGKVRVTELWLARASTLGLAIPRTAGQVIEMEILPQILVTGIALGVVYGLIGLTFTAIFNASKMLNFAQGDFIMIGAVLAVFTMEEWQIPLLPSLGIIAVATGALGLGLFFLVKPLLEKGELLRATVCTLAISLMVTVFFGLLTRHTILRVRPYWAIPPVHIGSASLSSQYIVLAAVAVALVIGYWGFSNRLSVGRALRATGFDREAGRIIGIPTALMIALAFVISGAMGGLSGSIVAPVNSPSAAMGLPLMIRGFVAIIVGGMGNAYAALVGGVIVGILATTLSAYSSAMVGEVATFLLLLTILIVRPQGIFGKIE